LKELWIEISEDLPEATRQSLMAAAAEAADVLVVSFRDLNIAKAFKKPIAGAFDGADIRTVEFVEPNVMVPAGVSSEELAAKVTVNSGGDEAKVTKAAKLGSKYVIIKCTNWKTIPLENIIAKTRKTSKVIVEVSNPEEAKLAIETLQLGADGVIYRPSRTEDIARVARVLKEEAVKIELAEGEVVRLQPIGMGARVCIDTCDLMRPREGILVGSQSSGLFLVESEATVNPFVEPRPFRVNAGPVASYVLAPSNRTRYLSELKAGDEVMIVDAEGNTRTTNICRVKIEWRPMILLEASSQGRKFNIILQNAETIRLVTEDGSKSVSEIKPGDKILMRTEAGGRHFGMKVDEESVIER